MGLVKEPMDVDFVVDSKPLTEAEKKRISEYIKQDKEKKEETKSSKRSLKKQE